MKEETPLIMVLTLVAWGRDRNGGGEDDGGGEIGSEAARWFGRRSGEVEACTA